MDAIDALQDDLSGLDNIGRLRALAPRRGLDFSSNDYLGLAGSERLRRAATAALERGVSLGSGGSRLLRGNTEEHELLEAEAARFFGVRNALFLGSGYSANALLFSSVPQRGDLIVHDELVHASAREGIKLARANAVGFSHNDVQAASDVIANWRRKGGSGTPWIAVESLYSMDGDRAPLADLADLAVQTDAMLLIDEAHATGVFGKDGRGLADQLDGQDNVITLKTCGKALGSEGALLLGPEPLREFVVNRGRSFIFSTAPSPLMAAVVRESLHILQDEPDRRDRLHALVRHAEQRLAAMGVDGSGSPIQPIVIGDDRRTMAIAAQLQKQGYDVRGIRPPTVPAGTSRLRVSLTLNVGENALSSFVDALEELL